MKLITENKSKQEYLSFILSISWLWTINVIIALQNFKIMIEDFSFNENIRKMIESKLFFCNDHNFLMYSKSIMTVSRAIVEEVNNTSFEFNNNSDFDDKLSVIENSKSFFIWVLSRTLNCQSIQSHSLQFFRLRMLTQWQIR